MPEGRTSSDTIPFVRNEIADVVPVVAETAQVEKRVVETKTVIQKTVSERDAVVDALLARHDVRVERVPVGRVVSEPPPARQEGDTWVFPILEEQLVVEKRLVLKEELRIRAETRHETVQQTVRLREEHVTVESENQPTTSPAPPGTASGRSI